MQRRRMQLRPILWLLLTALLYFAVCGIATRNVMAMGWQIPQRQPSPAMEPAQPSTAPAEVPEEATSESLPIENRSVYQHDHLAVILPLQASDYARFAQQVKQGIEMASSMAPYGAPPITVYSTTADTRRILEAYDKAVASGARAVIGPLTRDGVTALAEAGSVSVPTIALNTPDANVDLPKQMYIFGLQIEMEAAQVAKLAFDQGGRKALLVVGETALGQRIARAFSQKWKALKGDIADEFVYSTEAAALTSLRQLVTTTAADVVFLAVNAPRARFIRPYLGSKFPIYATSLVYASDADKLELYDLEGVRFMDMPWLLQADHPAVMTYLRAQIASSALDEERFYAVGVDAYRIAMALLQENNGPLRIDGVTGTIQLDKKQHFTHQLVPAFFAYGKARLLNGSGDVDADQ